MTSNSSRLNWLENTELEIWKETKEIDEPVDIMVPPRLQKEVKHKLKEATIPYDIEIPDLQKAIKNENPTVNASATNRNSGINNCANILLIKRVHNGKFFSSPNGLDQLPSFG